MAKYKDMYHEGKPAVRWGIMKKFKISSTTGEAYLTRWRLIATPYFNIFLHKIDGPDPDRHPHDHPWNFLSMVLWGGYHESVHQPHHVRVGKHHRLFSCHTMQRGQYHRIMKLDRKPTWTLVLTGPRKGDWGFLTNIGHVQWKEYLGV